MTKQNNNNNNNKKPTKKTKNPENKQNKQLWIDFVVSFFGVCVWGGGGGGGGGLDGSVVVVFCLFFKLISVDINLHYICMVTLITTEWGRNEGNVLFNDALNAFYLRVFVVRHMVKEHSDSERGALAGTRNSSIGPS